jgi:hypothetical protein
MKYIFATVFLLLGVVFIAACIHFALLPKNEKDWLRDIRKSQSIISGILAGVCFIAATFFIGRKISR